MIRTFILVLAILFLHTFFSHGQSVLGQGNMMSWVGVGVSKKFNKAFSMDFFQTNSFDMRDGFRLNFIQPGIKINYKKDKFLGYIGTKPTFSIDGTPGNQLVYHRLTSGVEYKFRFNKHFRGDVSLNFEHHFTQRSKFQQRYFLRLDLFYRDNDWPLRLRPFFNQKLYWYGGGKPLQYYDAEGDKTERLPTNGLHAYRWRVGLKAYPNKKVITALFFEQQREFNSKFPGTNPINDLNPNSGSIRRGFSHFSAFGVFCILNLR